jgi:hypothetical protein
MSVSGSRSFLPSQGVKPLEVHHTGHLGEKLGKSIKNGVQFAAQAGIERQNMTNRATELRGQIMANRKAAADAKVADTRARLAGISERQAAITERQKAAANRRRSQAATQSAEALSRNAAAAQAKSAENINNTQFGVPTPTPTGARTPRRATWTGGAPAPTSTPKPNRATHPGGMPIQTGKRTSLSTNPL